MYPNLPSSILISDMQTGLYVFSGAFPLALNNFEEHVDLIFPNPANNHFTIKNKKATSIVLSPLMVILTGPDGDNFCFTTNNNPTNINKINRTIFVVLLTLLII